MSMPPTQEAIVAPVSAYSHSSSRWTCSASSRVGAEALRAIEQAGRQRQAEGNRLARTRLGGNERVLAGEARIKHGLLHRRQRFVTALRQSLGNRRSDAFEISHHLSFGILRAPAGGDHRGSHVANLFFSRAHTCSPR